MSKKCRRCGATLKKSAKFCTVCGNAVAGAKATPSSPTTGDALKCGNCGNTLKEGVKFCTKCGSVVEEKAPAAPVALASNVCPHCGYGKNPESSNYCINCGQAMISPAAPQPTSEPLQPAPSPVSSTRTCQTCGREATPKSKFCIYCGGHLSTAAQSTNVSEAAPSKPVTGVKPIPVPAKVLAGLMARGRQLALEEEYVKNGTESDELLEKLSQAASDSDFELEELIDTYINERSELERLESLHKKGEVSERVYDRLVKEYEDKLTRMDEQIKEGIIQLHSYQVQIQLDHTEAKEELETLKTRHLIGDDETKGAGNVDKVSEKVTRLNYALMACEYILKKESAMRNGPLTRFEVTETTVADSKVASTESEDIEVIKSEEKVEEESKEEAKESESTSSQPAEDSESGKICSQCGRVTASDAKFCIHCAAEL
jgi:hypothetical protein